MHFQLHIPATVRPANSGPRASLNMMEGKREVPVSLTHFHRFKCLPVALVRVKCCVLFASRSQVIWEGCICVLTVPCFWDTGTEHQAVGSNSYQHITPSVPTDRVGWILPQHQGEGWTLYLLVLRCYSYDCIICKHHRLQSVHSKLWQIRLSSVPPIIWCCMGKLLNSVLK
jgi:hypothetical protein